MRTTLVYQHANGSWLMCLVFCARMLMQQDAADNQLCFRAQGQESGRLG